MDPEKSAVLKTVTSFLSTIGANNSPSLQASHAYILPSSFAALSHPDALLQSRLSDALTRVEAQLATLFSSGASSSAEKPCAPGPEVWVYENIAAVWLGYEHVVDGAAVSRGVNLFGLLKTGPEEDEEREWKIAGIADTQWRPDGATPTISSTITSDLMAPINTFFAYMRARNWTQLASTLLPGGGMTHSAANEPLRQVTWPEFVEGLKGVIEKIPAEVDVNEKVYDVEARVCGDMAFVWTPFVVEFNGVERQKGVNVWTLLRREGAWWVSGCQDWGRGVGS